MKTALLDEFDVLVREGVYRDEEALVQDALRALLRSKPELRSQLALARYKRADISLSRAAEVAGTDMETFKELLREAGIKRHVEPVGEAVGSEVDKLRLGKG